MEPSLRTLRSHVVVTPGAPLVLPEACACCLAHPAAVAVREAGPGGTDVIVPYCAECHFHVSAEGTRSLAASLSSGLFALTLAAVAPMIFPISLGGYVALVFAGAAAPVAAVLLLARRVRAGHAAPGRAVFWVGEGRLACSNAEWAEALAVQNGVTVVPDPVRAPFFFRLAWGGVVLAAIGILFFYPAHYPVVRVVNVTGEPLSILVDGTVVTELAPSSQESPGAGVDLRLRAGERVLLARNPAGMVLGERVSEVRGRHEHLYAPGSVSHCFWLESDAYGRQAGAEPRGFEPLEYGAAFWVLPERIDTWFSPNPTTASDARSSGGRLVALRQARCADSPAKIRQAADRGTEKSRLQAPSSDYSSAP